MKKWIQRGLPLLLVVMLCPLLTPAAFAGDGAFVLPADAVCIEAEAFYGCTDMISITIPAGVTLIGERAFYGCTNLRDVYYGGTETQWDDMDIRSGNSPLTRVAVHCGGDADNYYITLTYSNVFNPKEWNYKAAVKFADMVKQRTEGHVTIDYHGLAELDCYRNSVVRAVNGENWIGLEEPAQFADWVGDCAVLVGPMLYQNDGEYNYVMASDAVGAVKNALAAENIHILDTHYSFGFRSVITNRSITAPADLAGVRLRSTTAPLFIKTITAMGATPVPMSFIDCLTGIQQGVIDGFEGSTATLAGGGAPYELVKNVALTRHLIATRWLFMSESVYQAMPEKWRTILDACAAECGVWEQESSAAEEAVLIERLKNEAGVSYNVVDVNAFTDACDSVFDWIVSEYGADPTLHAVIVGMVRAYRAALPTPPANEPTLAYAQANLN